MKYHTLTLLALNQNTGIACNWTSAAKDCNLLRHKKDTRPVLSENPSNGLTESKTADSLSRRPTEKLISKAHLRHRPRPTGKHPPITSFTANPGFAQFLREYSSPKHHRVTAGGRIVPMQPVNRTMSAEGLENTDSQGGPQNINMQQALQGYMNVPSSQQGWHPLVPLAHQIQNLQYQGSNLNPPNPHPSFNLYYSVESAAHDSETVLQSNDNLFTMNSANQAGLVFWNTPQTGPIATPDTMAHLTARIMDEIESSMVNIEQMRSLHLNLVQRRLNVQEALDQANIAIAWTQVTQPIQRDLRITYINMRNIFDEAIGILESRIQLIYASTMPAHYGVGQPTGADMNPHAGGIFVNPAANEQTQMNWEYSSSSGVSVAHIERAAAEPQANTTNEVQYNDDDTAFMGSLHRQWGHSSGISVTHIESADVEPQANTASEMQFISLHDDHLAIMGHLRQQWRPSSDVSVTHIEYADTEPQANPANEVQFDSQYDDYDTASMGSLRQQWRHSSGISVTHIEHATVEPQADTANEVQFDSQYDDNTAFMGSSRLDWSPKRNLQVDERDSDSDNDPELHNCHVNQLDGTCSEDDVRHASDDELSPRRSSGFQINEAQNEGPSQFSWSSWPGNFLETHNDALLGVGSDIEPQLEETQQNWGKNPSPGSLLEGPLDSDQHEDHDGNETESESGGVDPKQNPHPLSRHSSKTSEAESDINNSLTSDEWTIFLSPPPHPHSLISHPTATLEVNEIDAIMSDNNNNENSDNEIGQTRKRTAVEAFGAELDGRLSDLSEMPDNNETNTANPEGGQADRNQATVVRQPDPRRLVNGEAEAQQMEQATAATLPNNLMAANLVGEMEDGDNNNRRGNATVQLSTAGALGELTQVARVNGARITPAVRSMQQVLAAGDATLARRRMARRNPELLTSADNHQEGEVQAGLAPLTPERAAFLRQAFRGLRGQEADDEDEDEEESPNEGW